MKKAIFILAIVSAVSVYADSPEFEFLKNETKKASVSDLKESDVQSAISKQMYKSNTSSLSDKNKLKDLKTSSMLNNEDLNNTLEKTIVYKLRTALEKMDLTPLKADILKNMTFSDLTMVSNLKMTSVDGISFVTTNQFAEKKGKTEFMESLTAYLEKFKKIEFVDAKIINTLPTGVADSKSVYTGALSENLLLSVYLQLEIRGVMTNGFRRIDKSEVRLDLNKSSANEYRISGLNFDTFQTLQINREPAFAAVAKNAGFDAGKTYPRLEALRRGGYAFAVEDFNKDGELDAFVGSYGASTVWVGAKGNFTEKSMEEVNKVTLAKAASFVDFDNDGWKDLIITRFASDNLVGDVLIFKNVRGVLKEVKNAFPSEILRDYAMPMAIADYNNDGLLDIYIGFPGERDFSAGMGLKNKDLVAHGLFMNKGGFQFVDKTKKLDNAFGSNIFPHGALASDFNMDGQVDILVMDDQKNLSPMYKNNGNGSFSVNNQHLRVMNKGYGMGVAAGDFNQDGLQDYLLSNATFNAQDRLGELGTDRSFVYNKELTQGLRIFMNTAMGNKFVETTDMAGLSDSGEAAGGVTVIDYDNDGLQDIYLVNGLWSGSSREDSIDSLFAKATALGIVNQNHLQDGMGDRSPSASKSIFMKILMKDSVGEGASKKTLSFAGYQRNRLFKNLGNGKFIEVGYLEGVDSMSDGYMSVVADMNKDGKPDLLLRNCDPGALDNVFAPIEVYQNNHVGKQSIWIGLKGKKSNSMGVGAKLYATIGDKTHYREIFANNSAVQGEVSAHFGMDRFDKVKKLKIVWPSGTVDIHTNLKPGHHQFEESVNAVAAADQ